MELSDQMWKEVGYVQSSTYRTMVMKSIAEETKIPSKIAKDTNIWINYMSNTLRELKEHDLVECVNPEVKKGRLL